MYYCYETEAFSVGHLNKFIKWYNNNIGADYEINTDDNEVSIMCIEVTMSESKQIKKKVNEFTNKTES